MVDLCLASFDGSVTLAAVTIATGVDRQFPGQDFHLLDPYSLHDAHDIPDFIARNTVILPQQLDLENLRVGESSLNIPRSAWS